MVGAEDPGQLLEPLAERGEAPSAQSGGAARMGRVLFGRHENRYEAPSTRIFVPAFALVRSRATCRKPLVGIEPTTAPAERLETSS